MSDNHLKTPLAKSLPRAIGRGVANGYQLQGKALPASVVSIVSSGIVTVKFELNAGPFTLPKITVPVQMSEYVRLPIRPGCKGYLAAADARLGGVTGLGGGAADLSQPANLGALVFVPLGNVDWTVVDLDTLVLYGEPKVRIMNKGATAVVDITDDGVSAGFGDGSLAMTSTDVTITFGGHSIVIDSGGVTIDGRDFLTHEHSGVQTGGGNSGPVA